MTGGQISPTSPKGSYGTTAPYGALERPFSLADLVTAAGGTYVADGQQPIPYNFPRPSNMGCKIKDSHSSRSSPSAPPTTGVKTS